MRLKQNITAFFLCLALAAGTSACSGGLPIVSEVRPEGGYSDAQTMLIIATEANRYRRVYTDQIWEVPVGEDGTAFQTYLLGEIRTFLRELKTMNLLAEESELKLTAQEREQLRELSDQFYGSLTREDLAYTGVSEDDVYAMYEDYHIANRLVDELTKDVNLEISDSEAKVITVQEIVVSDGDTAQSICDSAAAGEDFSSLARSYSEEGTGEISVGRSERSAAYEDAVFCLTDGQVSQPFWDNGKCYVVKCVEDYDEEATQERKEKLAVQRKDQAFRRIYDAFVAEHPVEISGSIWDTVSLRENQGSTTTDFFELYQDTMGQ